MDIRFSGQNIKITAGMKEHLAERLPKFEKYAPRLVEAHVFLKKEKYFFKAEITLAAKNFHAFGAGETKENVFAAMDEAYATWQALRKEGKTEEAREFREDNADSIKGYRNVEAVKGAIAKINHQIRVVELSERDIESKRIEINRLNALKDKFSRRLAP